MLCFPCFEERKWRQKGGLLNPSLVSIFALTWQTHKWGVGLLSNILIFYLRVNICTKLLSTPLKYSIYNILQNVWCYWKITDNILICSTLCSFLSKHLPRKINVFFRALPKLKMCFKSLRKWSGWKSKGCGWGQGSGCSGNGPIKLKGAFLTKNKT